MHGKIGWWRRDPELGKLKIQVLYHGRKFTFQRQLGRFKDWEEFKATVEDWEHLEKDISDRIQRGLMEAFWLDLAKKRGEK
ncbi:MAG: hypothetical protein SFY80_17135 [Verrucomicrobiota bacterium]|nr:hypothetical protein [Verrucomicrobiota bacterium]